MPQNVFNLFVSWEEDAFDSLAWVLDRSRFTEYTARDLIRRFSKLTPKAKTTLFSIPTLFIREGLQGHARVGYVRDLKIRNSELIIEFTFDESVPPFPAKDLSRRAQIRLDIGGAELSRTHWAIKNEDLLTILAAECLVPKALSTHLVSSQQGEQIVTAPAQSAPTRRIPRVFLSYSWESEEHKWVLELAATLRTDGIDVILDRWDLRPGLDKTLFMERSVANSDFVLIVCTPTYAKKAEERDGGVGYEAMVITGQLASNISQGKFIPLLRAGSWQASAPVWLQTKLGVDISKTPYSKAAYNELLRQLHGEWHTAPQIGPRPTFDQPAVQEAPAPPLLITHELSRCAPDGSTLILTTNRGVKVNRIEYLTGDNIRVSQQQVQLSGNEITIPLPHTELLKVWNLAPQDGTRIIFRITIQDADQTLVQEIPCVMRTDYERGSAGALTLFFRLVG